jgi:hypothetical protein
MVRVHRITKGAIDMTRRDYSAVAKILAGIASESGKDQETCDRVANNLADYFAGDNPRFDRDRFMSAYHAACAIIETYNRSGVK